MEGTGGTACDKTPICNDNRNGVRLADSTQDSDANGAVSNVIRGTRRGGRQVMHQSQLEAPREEDSDRTMRSREAPLLGRGHDQVRDVACNGESKRT